MERVHTLIRLLKERYKQIAALMMMSVALSVIAFLVQTRIYRAEASIMPLKDSRSSITAILGMFGSIPVAPSFLKSFGSSDVDRLIAILTSETIALRTIEALNLTPHLFPKRWDEDRNDWKDPDEIPQPKEAAEVFQRKVLKVKETDRGAIAIQVKFADPQMAVRIANQLLTELDQFINESSFSVGRKNREFLEKRLAEVQRELKQAEEEFKSFQERTGILLLDAQTEAAIELMAQLEAQKIAREIELGVMTKIASEQAPKVQLLKDELAELEKKIAELTESEKSDETLLPALKKSPELGLEYIRKKRELLLREKLYELITQQYELARIEENRELIAFQVIDAPMMPYKPCWPKLWVNVCAAIFAASLLSFIYLLLVANAEMETSRGKSDAQRMDAGSARPTEVAH